jgi:hypothetical protein
MAAVLLGLLDPEEKDIGILLKTGNYTVSDAVAYPRQHESSSNCTFQLQIRCTE